MRRNVFSFFLLLFVICTFAFSCKKQKNPIPDVYVDIYLNISSTLYLELSTVGGWVTITGGYRGIVVYRSSVDEFVAFEQACPYDWEADSAYVAVEPSGLILKCHNCFSEYLITDGSIVNGPAIYPLKQYKTGFDGQTLHIYN
ncbi:MAG: hypothetical protein WC401_06745 [Bacteroidales bacterium]|jgi:nitrite reductase/ring-hydroxylating ferredoxin subunit|nr:hypothetical protein [Bacteroidales bacterium]